MKQFGIRNVGGVRTATFDIDRDDASGDDSYGFFFKPPATINVQNKFNSPVYVYELKWTNQDDADFVTGLMTRNYSKSLMEKLSKMSNAEQKAYEKRVTKNAIKTIRTFKAHSASTLKFYWFDSAKLLYWIFSTQPIDKSKLPAELQGIIPGIPSLLGTEDIAIS